MERRYPLGPHGVGVRRPEGLHPLTLLGGQTRRFGHRRGAVVARRGGLSGHKKTGPRLDRRERMFYDAISGEEARIPYSRQLGQAFCALLERLDPNLLPAFGGDATTVLVTITLDALKADLATGALLDADLDAGPNLSATAIRRLACTAGIIPVVLGGHGEILDLGRTSRLFSAAQRKALRLRDQRCRAEACAIPATWCEAHHLNAWSEGGKTDLADGVLLCSYHHHRIHDPRYQTDALPNGDVRFHRRT